MKKVLLGLLCLSLGGLAETPAGTVRLQFIAPSFDAPHYRIQFPFEVKKDGAVVIKELRLNGSRSAPCLVFKNGKNIPLSTPLEKGLYKIIFDYAWARGKKYQVRLSLQPDGDTKSEELAISGVSPIEGGIPGGEEGFYRIYRVEEEIGLERRREIVTFTLTAPKADIEGSEFVIFDGRQSLPFEILEKRESVPPQAVAGTHPSTSTLKIALPLDANCHQKKWLLVLKGGGTARPAPGFVISGEGLGKSVRGSKLSLEFHPKSGQINTIEAREPGIKLFNKAGVIHWNPDVFIPGLGWDHSFDWNPPAVFEEKTGTFLYLNSRRGPLPRINGVRLEVRYTLHSEAPYFVSETRLDFEEDQGVIAVRNDEMVLFRELFDSLLYRNKAGEIIKLPLKEKEEAPFGLVHIAPEDLDWVGLVNDRSGYGFFSLRLSAANGNFAIPGEFFHRAGTYFYAPTDGDYVYWVRPLIYTWGEYFTNTHFTFVPRGSFFYEKNAYIVMPTGPDLAQQLDSLLMRLRNPLRVF